MTEMPQQKPSGAPSPGALLEQLLSTAEASALRSVANAERAVEAALVAGVWATAIGKPDRAIENYSLVLRLDPTNLGALTLRADAYCAVGNIGGALKDLHVCLPLLTGQSQILAAERIKFLEKEETKK